jgi:HSP20 family protein
MTTQTDVTDRNENRAEQAPSGRWFRPPVDIVEKADELLLVADLPGANQDSIDIDFDDGVLSIKGTVAPRYEEQVKFLLHEFGVGNFHRSFRVSEQIDAEGIRAEYDNGVLTIHLAKAEAAKPRKIEVTAR